jgi:hypothetical protein
MNTINTAATVAIRTKKFVARHKTALAVTATATIALVVHTKVVGQHNDFLKEHGLLEKFYITEED